MNFSRVMQQVEKYLRYDMIQQHTELPRFPEGRVKLLHACLSQKSLFPEHSEIFALVASLVQIGMDTHDLVPDSGQETAMKEIRSKQLKVLAGDYFSSCFYYLLSKIQQSKMIQLLANAVCEVNRIKLSLYVRMKEGRMVADEYLDALVFLKKRLFLPFSQLMQPGFREKWEKMLHSFASCEAILEELIKMDNPDQFHHSYGYWHIREMGFAKPGGPLGSDAADSSDFLPFLEQLNVKGMLVRRLEQQVESFLNEIRLFRQEPSCDALQDMAEPFIEYLSASRV